MYANIKLYDARLSPAGIIQATECDISQFEGTKTVFVSPLRRCLETAYFIFKRHPDFEKINFVIEPLLME